MLWEASIILPFGTVQAETEDEAREELRTKLKELGAAHILVEDQIDIVVQPVYLA
jgi:hypothetical protein